MARVSRSVLKLAVIGGLAAAAVKFLQRRSHPDPVVDRNAYNSWERLDETPPAPPADPTPEAVEPEPEPAAINGSAPAPVAKAEPAGNESAPVKKAPAKKAAATKDPVKKTAAKKATPAKKAAPRKAAEGDDTA